MNESAQTALAPRLQIFPLPGAGSKAMALIGVAAVVALVAGLWLWGKQPEYRVLFSNVTDRDGGDIIGVLSQMNVPYQFAEGGGAILVPAEKVHEVRLKLASQGLPKGGGVGFELMENQKLGVSQFLEQVNYQRALEGELSRSMQAISAVQSARVHIAFVKQSVFVREEQKPTASVMLNLYPGRSLEPAQVSAITHLVSSSVPDMAPGNVTVLDQNGNLLSEKDNNPNGLKLDPGQLKYVQDYESGVARRIEAILYPIVGKDNVHAEVTADLDFSSMEQAAETYKPNQNPTDAAIRSQQVSESSQATHAAAGVPGALSNQPPAPATAPLTQAAGAATTAATPAGASRKDATTNYEVDKTIQYTQKPMGGVKRLSAAVVLNYKKVVDKKGATSFVPLSAAEKTQIESLVKEAMGFTAARGDSLNVTNTRFTTPEVEAMPEIPLWRQPENISLASQAGKYLLLAAVTLYAFFAFVRPLLKKASAAAKAEPAAAGLAAPGAHALPDGTLALPHQAALMSPEEKLQAARLTARQDPRAVAGVVKNWVEG
jgi:flagellar M-ring protein FliF